MFGPAETFSGRVWSARGTGGSNDGGQMRGRGLSRVGQWKPGCASDVGRITRFVNGAHFAMCVGDATRSYSPRKVKKALRTFYHLRPDPADKDPVDTFLVHDSVEVARPGLTATWVIHSIEKPVIDGAHFTITRGGGKLLGQVIAPANAALTLVGGPGKGSFVNGKDYPPVKKKPDPEAGAWRIEFPFKTTALVVLTAVNKPSKLTRPPITWRASWRHSPPGFGVKSGQLHFDFAGEVDKALPPLRVYQDGKLVETVK